MVLGTREGLLASGHVDPLLLVSRGRLRLRLHLRFESLGSRGHC
jgi:hypothetical protein